MKRRPFFVLVVAAVLGAGAAGCVADKDDPELNPQPLPPADQDDGRFETPAGEGQDSPGAAPGDAGAEDAGAEAGTDDGGDSSTDGGLP